MEAPNKYLKHPSEEYKNKLKNLGATPGGGREVINMTIRIYKQNEQYFMEDNGQVTEVTGRIQDKPNGKGKEIKLPFPNSANRKYVALDKVDPEIVLEEKVASGHTGGEKPKTVTKMSKIEELLKDTYPEIYEELERLAQIEALEAELEAQREIRKALKAKIEALKNPKAEEKTEEVEA